MNKSLKSLQQLYQLAKVTDGEKVMAIRRMKQKESNKRLKKKNMVHTDLLLTEHQEAVSLAEYLFYQQRAGKIELYTHIPHETYTQSWAAKRKNKAEGVKSGVPDYIIVTKDKVLFIELKRKNGGYMKAEQKEWLGRLKGKTTESFLAKGAGAAIDFIESHL